MITLPAVKGEALGSKRFRLTQFLLIPIFSLFSLLQISSEAGAQEVDYSSQIRPILTRNCYRCHGPTKQENGLRLDLRERALEGGNSGLPAIVPDSSASSHLIERVTSKDESFRMPRVGEPLEPTQIALLRLWIDQGAPWPQPTSKLHWAYVPPSRPSLPQVSKPSWVRNPIDQFILARLEQEGLQPSGEADRATLIRRLSLDLTGLPPSVEEVDAFIADQGLAAYERLVDRLLTSPHYGEHMARHWLDLARYADSNGYQIDRFRPMWMYRDWVIGAFNRNMPFDEFTLEQLAGDLLPEVSLNTKIATGFLRNSMFNDEDGADPEEFRVKAIKDRVNTTMTVWMASTLGCAQCHDHKFDSFSQKEYYQLFAFFGSAADKGAGTPDDVGPLLRFPTVEQQEKLSTIQSEMEKLQQEITLEEKAEEEGNPSKSESEDYTRLEILKGKLEGMKKKEWKFLDQIPSALIMQDEKVPRQTHMLTKGDFERPGEMVTAGVPAAFHSFPADQPFNRLGLAAWLLSKENPLTTRVTVNRLWALFFGRGLVSSSDDFGSQGDLPSHPDLLDWLATEFMRGGWDVKAFVRLMVTSATYRQSSRVTEQLSQRDPKNTWLARAPRYRLEAERIRDNVLAISGLLNREIGGASVFPPQPEGIWSELTAKGFPMDTYVESRGKDRYRRGIYTFWRRSAPYPTFGLFDAPNRKQCTAERPRTTTPLQALATLNDPAFVEASLGLARRLLTTQDPAEVADRLVFGFRLCLARPPKTTELARLQQLYNQQWKAFRQSPEAAKAVADAAQEIGPAQGLDPVELGAWSVIASVLLNLDETVTRN